MLRRVWGVIEQAFPCSAQAHWHTLARVGTHCAWSAYIYSHIPVSEECVLLLLHCGAAVVEMWSICDYYDGFSAECNQVCNPPVQLPWEGSKSTLHVKTSNSELKNYSEMHWTYLYDMSTYTQYGAFLWGTTFLWGNIIVNSLLGLKKKVKII